jgi:hypothetical protein
MCDAGEIVIRTACLELKAKQQRVSTCRTLGTEVIAREKLALRLKQRRAVLSSNLLIPENNKSGPFLPDRLEFSKVETRTTPSIPLGQTKTMARSGHYKRNRSSSVAFYARST